MAEDKSGSPRYAWGGLGDRVLTVTIVVILAGVFVVTIYPFLHVAAVSLSRPMEVLENRVTFFPRGFYLYTYKRVLQDQYLLRSYLNTILYTTVGVIINFALTIMTAYPLSRPSFWGRAVFLRLIVFTMLFTGGMIPTYILVMNLGLIDSMWAVVLAPAINTFNLMILRTAFQGVPVELEESAKIDGANDWQILRHIVLPVSKTILMTIGLFYAVEHWNSFYVPFLYLNTKAKFPLQIILRSLLISGEMAEYGSDRAHEMIVSTALKYTTIVVTILPIICVYPFIQRYFTRGVLLGSLKE